MFLHYGILMATTHILILYLVAIATTIMDNDVMPYIYSCRFHFDFGLITNVDVFLHTNCPNKPFRN